MARRSAVAGLLAITMITAACDANLPSPVASRSGGPSATAPPSTTPGVVIDLTGTAYAAEAGTDGGAAVIGDTEQANQFNPFYLREGSEQAVASAAWATLVTVTHDRRYSAGPRDVRPDGRQRRRRVARQGRRRHDRQLEAPGRPQRGQMARP